MSYWTILGTCNYALGRSSIKFKSVKSAQNCCLFNGLQGYLTPPRARSQPIRHSSTNAQDDTTSGRTKLRSVIELMRLHKPTGTMLALTPSLWSVGLATPKSALFPDPTIIAIFTAGAFAARGMGCTLNDILDRKYDKHVERTKLRPIACGDITVKEALFYLSIQSCAGLYILCLNNLAVIKLGLFSGLMISSYPLFKRFTYWPQLMLGLTMNWGVLMGYAAIKGSIHMDDLPMLLPIYAGSVFWTLFYDTIYAHQDKKDDMFIGVKSTALKLGPKTKGFLYLTSGCMSLSLLMAGLNTAQAWPFYFSIMASSVIQNYQVRNLNLDNTEMCWTEFDRQKYIGFLILAGVLGSVAINYNEKEKSDRESNDLVENSSKLL